MADKVPGRTKQRLCDSLFRQHNKPYYSICKQWTIHYYIHSCIVQICVSVQVSNQQPFKTNDCTQYSDNIKNIVLSVSTVSLENRKLHCFKNCTYVVYVYLYTCFEKYSTSEITLKLIQIKSHVRTQPMWTFTTSH